MSIPHLFYYEVPLRTLQLECFRMYGVKSKEQCFLLVQVM
jgi:hypothetical protein